MCSCQIFKLFKIHRQRNSFSHPLSPTPVCTPPTAPLNTLPAFCYLSAPQFPLIPFPPPTIRCLHFAVKSWQSSFPSTIILPAPCSSTQTNLSLFFFSCPDTRTRCWVTRTLWCCQIWCCDLFTDIRTNTAEPALIEGATIGNKCRNC